MDIRIMRKSSLWNSGKMFLDVYIEIDKMKYSLGFHTVEECKPLLETLKSAVCDLENFIEEDK